MNYAEITAATAFSASMAELKAAHDADNLKILARRQEALLARRSIGQGDFVVSANGEVRRVAHDWGDFVQLSSGGRFGGSFYLGERGYVSYSGALDPGIPASRFEATDDLMEGDCWFFSRDFATAHNAYRTKARFRVWRMRE